MDSPQLAGLELVSIIVLQLATIGTGFFLRSYLVAKAKNLATKEDVSDLTRRVETVKSEFRAQEERLRAQLRHAGAVRRARFDIELQSYQELWKAFLELEALLLNVQSLCLARQTAGSLIPDAYHEFSDKRDALEKSAEQVGPFIDPGVRKTLGLSILGFREIAAEAFFTIAHTEEDRNALIKRWVRTAGEARHALGRSIGERLFGSGPAEPYAGEPHAKSD